MDIIIQIIIFAALIFGLIVIFELLNIDLNPKQGPKVLLGTATIEAMESRRLIGPNPDLAIDMSEFHDEMKMENSFCSHNSGDLHNLEKQCNNLSKDNCSKVSCCGYLNDTKCVNGNRLGPNFRTDNDGKTIQIDSYYYMNKCTNGKKCQE
jgi:hypothetical protein